MPKPIRYTLHAETVLIERDLAKEWVERTVYQPEWRTSEPRDSSAERRFRTLPERHGRILRVICVESTTEIRIISVFLDRRARRPE